jgi:hypothetical protein
MTSTEKVAAALEQLMDGLVKIAEKRDYTALQTLCEAMVKAPPRLRTLLAKRLLDLEVNRGIETPHKYRHQVELAVQSITTEADHLEKFRLHSIEGGGEGGDTNDRPPPKLRVVKDETSDRLGILEVGRALLDSGKFDPFKE